MRDERPARRVGAALVALGGLAPALPLWVWWAIEGGYAPGVWLPGVVWLAAGGALLVLALPRRSLAPRTSRVALAAAGALALWALASVAWADDRGAAWTGALRWLLYALAVAAPVLRPPTDAGLRAGVVLAVVAGCLAAASGVVDADGGSERALPDGRLAAPTGYPNATAVLLVASGAAGLAAGACARHRLVAFALAAAGGGLVATSVLTQSRGGIAAATIVALAAVLLVPARVRLLLVLGASAAAIGAGWETLTDVRRLALEGAPGDGLAPAALAIAGTGLVAGLAAAAVPRSVPRRAARALDRRPRLPRRLVIAAAAVAVAGTLAGGGAGWLDERWTSFKTPDYATLEEADSRFTGDLGSNRYDYWRVAVAITRDHPLLGVGADGFAGPYLLDRRSAMTPRYAHEWWLEAAATLGLPGLLALLTLAATLLGGALRAVRASRQAAAWRAAALLPAVAVAAQGSADWTHTFPAATLPALGLLAAVAGLAGRGGPSAPPPPQRSRRGTATAVAGVAVMLAVTAPPWVASRLQAAGNERARTAPLAAERDFAAAARWNPLAAGPELSRGSVALFAGRLEVARDAFARAAGRNPSGWFAPFVLGLLDAQAGRQDQAIGLLARAQVANPRDPLVARTLADVRAGRRPDPAVTAAAVLGRS